MPITEQPPSTTLIMHVFYAVEREMDEKVREREGVSGCAVY